MILKKRNIFMFLSLISACLMNSSTILAKPRSSAAKPMLSISPMIISLQLSPGKIYSRGVYVTNLMNTPLSLRAHIEPFTALSDSENKVELNPLSKWTTITPVDMIIPAGAQKKITLTIRMPRKIPIGGYYGSLSLEPLFPINAGQSTMVKPQINVLIMGSIGVPNASSSNGVITRFGFDTALVYERDPKIDLSVKNVSLYHFSAKPILTLKPIFGNTTQLILDEKIILPAKERSWENSIPIPNKFAGLYFVNLATSVGGGEQIIKKSILLVGPYVLGLKTFILIVCVMILIRIRRRLSKAFSALLQN